MSEFNDPQKLANRPGLSALTYRLGDYHAFRRYLLDRLSVELPSLTARDRDDVGIALLDAWAVVADVLTFYQERIANEGYLNTATELRSVLELARSIGYELQPRAAAATYLAFTVEDRPETAAGVQIPLGTQVMSIPGEGESPQTFETSEAILARPDWNALKPRTSKPPEITNSTQQLYLQGISTQLAPGDPLLLVGEVEQSDRYYLRFLTTVEPIAAAGHTLIAWEQPLPLPPQTFLRHLQVFAFRLQASLFGHNAPRWQEMPAEIKREAGGTLVGGVFRTPLEAIAWESASEGLPNQDIFCLAAKDDAGYLFAGTAGRGIFRFQESDRTWKVANTGLTNLTVQALFIDERGHLFAGTPGGGVFRSKDNGENWVPIGTGTVSVQFQGKPAKGEAVNTGLPNTVVRSLLAYESGGNYYIFAGTDDSIYRTTDGGQNWYSEKTPEFIQENLGFALVGLSDKVVNALCVIRKEQLKARGKITAINSTTIEVEFETGNLVKNDVVIVEGQARIIANVSGNTLTINKIFSPNIKSGISFSSLTIKATGIIDVVDDKNITISNLANNLNKGDIITVDKQTRVIANILEAGKFELDRKLNASVKGKQILAFEVKATGLIEEIDRKNPTKIKIQHRFGQLLANDNITIANDEIRTITKILADNIIEINEPLSSSIKPGIRFFSPLPTTIFAGTDNGIYASSDNGMTWNPIGLQKDSTNQAKIVYAIAVTYSNNNPNYIFAGTNDGIYRLEYTSDNWQESWLPVGLEGQIIHSLTVSNDNNTTIFAGTKDGVYNATSPNFNQWSPFNKSKLNEKNIRDLSGVEVLSVQAIAGSNNYLLAGTRFVGFVEDKPAETDGNGKVTQKTEWPEFQLKVNEIDLDTLYPRIITDSWMVLLNKHEADENNSANLEPEIAAFQVEDVLKVPRKAFTIDAKISRVIPAKLIDNPESFGLRTATVFAQSEKLELIADPITVAAKQHQIFIDPIWDNKIFLRQFVQGLEAKKPLMISGKRIRAKINAGGFFLSKNWQKTPDSEIADAEIQAMTINGEGEIFVATKDGVFRSSDRGSNWQSINQGLEDKTATCLLAYSKSGIGTVSLNLTNTRTLVNYISEDIKLENLGLQVGDMIAVEQQFRIIQKIEPRINPNDITGRFEFTINAEFSNNISTGSVFTINKLLAGTDKGIFRFNEDTQKWEPASQEVNKDLQDIQSLAFNLSNGYLFAGTQDGKIFRSQDGGQDWQLIKDFSPTGIRTLAINPVNEYLFVGTTERGIYRSTDNGNNWEHFGITQLGTGTIASKDMAIKGNKTAFRRELKIGYIITAADQSRIITQIISDTELRVDVDFLPNLPPGTPFTISTELDSMDVSSLAIQAQFGTVKGDIWAGISKVGIFRSQDSGQHWQPINNNLTEREICCLEVNGNSGYLFAGTASNGVFRWMSQDNFWQPINAGLSNKTVRSFAFNPQSSGELWVGTKEGVFYTQENGKNWTNLAWEQSNQDLTYTSVQTLTWYRETGKLYLFVGTREGVFRSRNYEQNWEPINEGLSNRNIQALAVVKNPMSETPYLLAGTANGIFRSSDGGRNWQQSMRGLSSPNVQVMVVKEVENQGDSANQKLLVFAGTLEGGVFISEDQGQNWKPTALMQPKLTQQKIQALAIAPNNIPENSPLQAGSILAGTPDGIFYSTDNGSNWQQWADFRPGSGTISSDGITVTGQDTQFKKELIASKTQIRALNQTRTITSIDPDRPEILTVDLPFLPELPPKTPFTSLTGLNNPNVTALAIDAEGNIFAGTGGSGIFCSEDGSQWWEAINEGLTNLEIRCLFADNETGTVFAGTFSQKTIENGEILPVGGVFRLKQDGKNWEAIETGMTNTDVRAIASDGVNLLVGGAGILLAPEGFYAVPLEAADWLKVVAAPVSVTSEPAGVQKWQVRNRDGFVGSAATAGNEEISLYPASEKGETVSEFCTLQKDLEDQQQPVLSLEQPLKYSYDPETVKIYANVATATHGETASEILGSGNGTASNQKFEIQKLPLTYTLDPTVGEARSTLKVYVNEVQWTEVPSLYSEGVDSRSQCYVIRIQADGTTEIVFGDGEEGVRLPSGLENIMAIYRSGIGGEGNVAAGSLSLLKTRPLGVVEVINPLPATGGVAREELVAARDHAPASVRTLGRIVSLRDFEDFALTFPGIGKAQAVPLWDGMSQFLHLTVAGIDGALVPPDSILYANLVQAIAAVRDPTQRAQVDSYEPRYFRLEAKVVLDDKYKSDKVLAEIDAALQRAFSFAVREFGQPVTEAEAIAAISNVAGVVAVDIDALYLRGASRASNPSLEAATAAWDVQKQRVQPAQLLLFDPLDPAGITLLPVTAL